jgi:hypothetical protein
MRYFMLDNDRSLIEVSESNLTVWKLWMGRNVPDHIVGRMEIVEDYLISTAFMGQHDDVENPAPFITAVFAQKTHPVFTTRWRTWEEAEAGHRKIVIRTFIRWVIEREHEGYPIQR